jgi:hypothetical protein
MNYTVKNQAEFTKISEVLKNHKFSEKDFQTAALSYGGTPTFTKVIPSWESDKTYELVLPKEVFHISHVNDMLTLTHSEYVIVYTNCKNFNIRV